ncbi:flagellar assembly protein FliW [Arthrobacter sp. NyZ413]|uniref:flagellar assembly protein FliW n=1 Tax=Arthrobacter sp. NyZ413 TaxID=3144669 RepID=UPI003BF7A07B
MSTAPEFRELSFTAPMPGLEAAASFVLREIDGAPGLFAMESASPPIRMFVADAAVYVPDYAPTIPRAVLEELGLGQAGLPTTLVVVNPTPERTTVNLAAPIVLNAETGRCTQLVLDGADYPLRAELGA